MVIDINETWTREHNHEHTDRFALFFVLILNADRHVYYTLIKILRMTGACTIHGYIEC